MYIIGKLPVQYEQKKYVTHPEKQYTNPLLWSDTENFCKQIVVYCNKYTQSSLKFEIDSEYSRYSTKLEVIVFLSITDVKYN